MRIRPIDIKISPKEFSPHNVMRRGINDH